MTDNQVALNNGNIVILSFPTSQLDGKKVEHIPLVPECMANPTSCNLRKYIINFVSYAVAL